jgi:hypothetical protein
MPVWFHTQIQELLHAVGVLLTAPIEIIFSANSQLCSHATI